MMIKLREKVITISGNCDDVLNFHGAVLIRVRREEGGVRVRGSGGEGG
jgi:hypothetical protein